jgi:8-oxo-dGTP pyrophosphatase MutT (NUDIX family)
MPQSIDVTVAAIVERDEHYLVVEERVGGKLVLNQPAGHVEPGESLVAAVVRETLEETGHRFEPREVVGIYLWHSDDADTTFLRVAFCGTVHAPSGAPRLDDGIVGVLWLPHREILKREQDLRSPMVLQCLNDFAAGIRYPLACLTHLTPVAARPARSARG